VTINGLPVRLSDVLTDDRNIASSLVDQQLTQHEDEASVVAVDDDNSASVADEPSVQCLATDLLAGWHSLKVLMSEHSTFHC